MKIDRAEVEHVAGLARLRLTDAEVEKMTEQLNRILNYMEKLRELDTTGIEPMAHPQPIYNAFREDVPRPSLSPETALTNAPGRNGAFFQVPRVL